MPLELRIIAALALAAVLVYLATPVAIRVAEHFDFYDKPAGYKGHSRPTPYLGGAAVMAGFLVSAAAFGTAWASLGPVLAGAAILWVVGTVDDRRTLGPWLRVAIEVLLAAGLWTAGLGWSLGAGAVLDLCVTIAWVVLVVNAVNLSDNMDGTASSIVAAMAAGITVLGMIEESVWIAVASSAACGACLGFLPRNLSRPARIFLGDGGSMPLGFSVGALAMAGATQADPGWSSLLLAALLGALPLFDTAMVMVSRRRRGVSVLQGGQDHLTYRLAAFVTGPRRVCLLLAAVQLTISCVSVEAFAVEHSSFAPAIWVAAATMIALTLLILLETRVFGETERRSEPMRGRARASGLARLARGAERVYRQSLARIR